MTDQRTLPTPPVDPSADPQASGKNPLDVLDQLLNDAQEKSQAEAAVKEAEEQRKFEEEKQKRAQQEALELEQKKVELANLKTTPQYQARVSQAQEEADTQQQKAEVMKGMEIRQLGHTKIQVEE